MSEALTIKKPDALVAAGAEWAAIQEQARTLIASGFMPRAVNTPAKAIAVMLAGRELGLPPMQSIRAVNIVDGKPTLSAETMLALAYQRVPGLTCEVATTDVGATVTGARPGGKPVTVSFTRADAERAGLLGKDNWRKYPAAMYRARAISAWCRVVAPDAILGCYTPEEIESIRPEPTTAPVIDVTHAQEVHEDHRMPGFQDDPRPTQEEAAQDEPGSGDGPATSANEWTGVVKSITQRTGQGKRGPWTLYLINGTDGLTFSTFDKAHAVFAKEAGTSKVRIAFERDEKNRLNIFTIEPAA